jgi:type II secretory pathway pseudopilin PulG
MEQPAIRSGGALLATPPLGPQRGRCLQRPSTTGFVLWEVMLALTIFCVVAVGLTAALHQTVDTSIVIRDESQVRQELQNLLTETASTKVKPGKSEIHSSDGRILFEREIRAIQAKTERGEQLPNLYEIDIQASWRSSGQDRTQHANMIVYRP